MISDDESLWFTCPLGQWMLQQRSALASLERSGSLVWLVAAADLTRLGLTDHLGQPPTEATAEATWNKIVQRERAGF